MDALALLMSENPYVARIRIRHLFLTSSNLIRSHPFSSILSRSDNCAALRQEGGGTALFKLLEVKTLRLAVLRVVQQLIVDRDTARARDDFSALMEALQSANPVNFGTGVHWWNTSSDKVFVFFTVTVVFI